MDATARPPAGLTASPLTPVALGEVDSHPVAVDLVARTRLLDHHNAPDYATLINDHPDELVRPAVSGQLPC